MMILSSAILCLIHGAIDVSNIVNPLIIITDNGRDTYFLISSIGLALGLFFLGRRVMNTVGNNILFLDFAKGFSA